MSAAAGAALDAVFPAAGQPNLFEELAEEGLTAHKVRKVFVLGNEEVDEDDLSEVLSFGDSRFLDRTRLFSIEKNVRED